MVLVMLRRLGVGAMLMLSGLGGALLLDPLKLATMRVSIALNRGLLGKVDQALGFVCTS